jgi:hypothetical protein
MTIAAGNPSTAIGNFIRNTRSLRFKSTSMDSGM